MIKKIDKAFGIWPEDGLERWQKWSKSVGPFIDDNYQLSSPEWKHYEDLINRPLFSRVGVLQEIGLTSRLDRARLGCIASNYNNLIVPRKMLL